MKDYYAILGITFPSTPDEINNAYRQMAKKWHPDLNPGRDVTNTMRDINEAAEILRDPIKKQRYDTEYTFAFIQKQEPHREYQWYENAEYEPKDGALRDDINTARKNAEDYVMEFMEAIRTSSKLAAKGAWEEMRPWIIVFIVMGLISVFITIL